MSDKELEEYINKIEPNFNSHLEKGTIEMSNEYYNLLEEKMVRLINKNQELNKKYENAVADYEKTMFEKEQILKQQKEFIKYMNDIIEDLETEDVDDEEMKGYLIQRINTFKEILSKFKELGGKDE